MQHHTAEVGKLAGALALLAEHEADALDDLARLQAAVAGGSHAELVEAALAPLGFRARRIAVLGSADDLVVLRRPGDAPPCTFLFHADSLPVPAGGARVAPEAARGAPGVTWDAPEATCGVPGVTRGVLEVTPGASGITRGVPGLPGQLAACLAALRAAARAGLAPAFTPALILAPDPAAGAVWPGVRALAEAGEVGGEVACFDGVAVPRVWPGCFGTLEALIRVRGRASHPGAPGRGVNAIEAGVPVLQALAALGRSVARRGVGPARREPDAPLRARLTLAAVHGGQRGSSLATVFDVLVNRRYTPAECRDDVLAELGAAVEAALTVPPLDVRPLDASAPDVSPPAASAPPAPGVEVQVTHHAPPAPDPLGARRSRAEAALGFALGWPHEVLRLDPAAQEHGWEAEWAASRPASVLLGGVWRAAGGGADEPGAVLAQARAILAYLAAEFRPGTTA